MIKVFFLFIVLIAGIMLGPMIAGHQGYVLIQTDNWNIETSVTGLAIILIFSLFIILTLEWMLKHLFHTGVYSQNWFSSRKRRRAQRYTQNALMKLIEGDFNQVEKLLSKDAEHADVPLVNYLLAAEAAQQSGDEMRANQHLERATELSKNDIIPVEITRVRIQLTRHENHAARHSIDHLLELAPYHPEVLRLAEQTYLRTRAWNAILALLPTMKKFNISNNDHLTMLQQQAWLGLMHQAMADQGSEGLKHWWRNLSRKTRQQTTIQVAMINHLIECNDHDTAQAIILWSLKGQYDERLVLLMPRIKTSNPEALEKALRQQIKQYGSIPPLQSTLGKLLMRQGEWQQAAEALKQALIQRPDAFDYSCLADTYDYLHRPEEAAKMRCEGLLLTLKNTPEA